MPAYAIAHLTNVRLGEDIARYLQEIDATLEPHEGRFIVHGARPTVVEGELPGDIIVIEFPTREQASAWYASPAYQAILPLRTSNADGIALIVDGVDPGHRATDVLDPGTLAA